ncbi:phosphotransferase [Nocardia sp. NPDC004068]|uniref:phosphotransferase n=1 Tax=Nocardia sp. NPDC004068 TaxID=3364303 RepID=UPI0036780EC8
MFTLPEPAAAAARAAGVEIAEVVHRTDKTLCAAGSRDGRRVVIKLLLDPEPFWIAKWQHEIRVYRLFRHTPPPVRTPELLFTDDERLMVLSWLDGTPLDSERYPQRTLTPAEIDAVLAGIATFTHWHPPAGALDVMFDYSDRFRRYHAAGYLSDADAAALEQLLNTLVAAAEPNHGDLLASNILMDKQGEIALLDWEFTGLFLPGFDLALSHTLFGAATSEIRRRIDDTVTAAGTERPFLINLAAVLTRELRIHHELPEGPQRAARLNTIEAAWAQARERIHRLARRSP